MDHCFPPTNHAALSHQLQWKEASRQAESSGKERSKAFPLAFSTSLPWIALRLNCILAQAARHASIKPLARWKALPRCIIQSSKPCTVRVIRINVCPWGWTGSAVWRATACPPWNPSYLLSHHAIPSSDSSAAHPAGPLFQTTPTFPTERMMNMGSLWNTVGDWEFGEPNVSPGGVPNLWQPWVSPFCHRTLLPYLFHEGWAWWLWNSLSALKSQGSYISLNWAGKLGITRWAKMCLATRNELPPKCGFCTFVPLTQK